MKRYSYCIKWRRCPWAHRTIITRILKGLEDIIDLVEVDGKEEGKGWKFTGTTGPNRDPLYGFQYMRQLYGKADSAYKGSITVPVLWDKKKGKRRRLHNFYRWLNRV